MGDASEVLLVAATEIELCDHPGLACGVGPVEAAIATARELALGSPRAVVHVGVAGAHGITPGGLVIGSEAVYSDISAEIPVVDRVAPDERLLAVVREALPEALILPIGTSAAVGGTSTHGERALRVEAMEGFAVLRACAQAGVAAIEIRAISNELAEGDRARWRIGRALEALAEALPRVLEAAAK
jgi:futalosine hydrolase